MTGLGGNRPLAAHGTKSHQRFCRITPQLCLVHVLTACVREQVAVSGKHIATGMMLIEDEKNRLGNVSAGFPLEPTKELSGMVLG